MSRPKSPIDLEKVTLNLFKGDWEFIATRYPNIGPSRVIRDLVRMHRRKLEKSTEDLQLTDLDLEIDFELSGGKPAV